MKKLTAIALVLFLTLSLFVGCAKESTYQLTQVDNVSISISDVSSTGATVTIKDSNEEAYVYGEWYKIEKEKDGKWYEVETVISNYGFNDLGYLTDKDGEIEFPIDWEWLYGELPDGTYRLIKEVGLQHICVEFSI